MTGKEIVQHIKNVLYSDSYYLGLIEEELQEIEKGFEVLELLKKHLSINSWGDIVYESKHHYQYIKSEECKLFKPNEEDIKIKEWLEDDKYM